MPPSGSSSIFFKGRRLMSTKWLGCSMSSFMRSSRFVPPLMNLAPVLETAATAARGSVARSYVNSFHDVANGGDDVRVGGAPADIAAHSLANLRSGQCSPLRRHVDSGVARPAGSRFGQHADRGAYLSWRAVAALERIALDERGLQGMERLRLAQTFDRYDVVVLVHNRQRQARVDAPAVDEHRTGAALPVVAALLRARQMQKLAQRIEQRCARVQLEAVR